jgi:hypothetical protein
MWTVILVNRCCRDMPAEVVRFGDGLELDGGAYELGRSRRALKLEIPLEILLLLVARRGQLVAREVHHQKDLG